MRTTDSRMDILLTATVDREYNSLMGKTTNWERKGRDWRDK
ncbi:MAG: hypothetical protein QW638_07245 [Candidatus Bathyarchaeia archaeon]